MRVGVAHQQGVTVSRRLGDKVGGDGAGGAGAVLDQHRVAPDLGEALRNHPRDDVGAAAWREADQDANRFGRVSLCLRSSAGGEQQCCRNTGESGHASSGGDAARQGAPFF